MDQNHDILLLMKIITDRAAALVTGKTKLPVTSAQCRILSYLASRGDEKVAQKDIEKHLGVTHSTAKGLLQRLEEKGFVRTAFDSEDKRVKHIYRTPQSNEIKEAVFSFIQRMEEQLYAGFDAEELAQLTSYLRRIYANILS